MQTVFVLDLKGPALSYAVAYLLDTLKEDDTPAIWYHKDDSAVLSIMDKFELFPSKSGWVDYPVFTLTINYATCYDAGANRSSAGIFNAGCFVQDTSLKAVVLKALLVSRLQGKIPNSDKGTIPPSNLTIAVPDKYATKALINKAKKFIKVQDKE